MKANRTPVAGPMGNAQARRSALPVAAGNYTSNPTGAQTAGTPRLNNAVASIMPYGMTSVSPMMGNQGLFAEQAKMNAVDIAANNRMQQIDNRQQFLDARYQAAGQNQYARMGSVGDIAAPSPQDMAAMYRQSALNSYRSGAGGAIGAGMERRFAPAASLGTPAGMRPVQVGGYGSPVSYMPVGSGQQTMDDFRASALANLGNKEFTGPFVSQSGGLTSRQQFLRENGRESEANQIASANEAKWDRQEERKRILRESRGGYSDYQMRQMNRNGRTFAAPKNEIDSALQLDRNPVRQRQNRSALDMRDNSFTIPGGMADPQTQRKAEETVTRLTSPDTQFDTSTPKGRQEYAQASILQSLGMNLETSPHGMRSSVMESLGNPQFVDTLKKDPASRKAFVTAMKTYVTAMRSRSQKWSNENMSREDKRLIDSISMSNIDDEREQQNILDLFLNQAKIEKPSAEQIKAFEGLMHRTH